MIRSILTKKLNKAKTVEQAISILAKLQEAGIVENVQFQVIDDDIDVDLYFPGGEVVTVYNLLTDRIISL